MERPEGLQEVVGQARLASKVTSILERIEAELDSVDSKIGERMHILDLDNDGLVACPALCHGLHVPAVAYCVLAHCLYVCLACWIPNLGRPKQHGLFDWSFARCRLSTSPV